MATKKPKVDIFKQSKEFIKKGTASTKKFYVGSVEPKAIKAGGKLARHYKRYVRPTTKLARGVGRFVRGATKLALRFPGSGLAATGAYYGAKHLIKRGERVATRTAFKQYDKKGKWVL